MPAAQAELDSLLPQFISGDPKAAEKFPLIANPLLKKFARRFAPDIATDLLEEIVQEAYLYLVNGGGREFDSRRGTARKFLFGVVLNAAQRVRSDYCAPGQRTRRRSNDIAERDELAIVPFDEGIHSDTRALSPGQLTSLAVC